MKFSLSTFSSYKYQNELAKYYEEMNKETEKAKENRLALEEKGKCLEGMAKTSQRQKQAEPEKHE